MSRSTERPSPLDLEPGAGDIPGGDQAASEVVTLLSDLIAIPSENPPGDTTAIAAYIEQWFLGVEGAEVRAVAPPQKPEAPSVIATIGSGEHPVVMLHAHIDTVPVGESEAVAWSSDPFRAVVRDGKLFGKGAVDDKGILAAMMCATRDAARMTGRRGTVVLVAAAEEEVGGQLGTRWLAENGHLPESDYVIVGEQTDNAAATAHKGVMRATVTVRGRSSHATNPDRGVSAINGMARVLLALEAYHRELSERPHPLVGAPTCNVGTIVGGSTTNSVPDHCMITIDRRMVPREDFEAVRDELRAVVAAVDVAPATAEVGDFLTSSWFESDLETGLGPTFSKAIEASSGGPVRAVGYLPGSDAKHLFGVAQHGMVVFGPGSYEMAHAADEYVGIADLEASRWILTRFLELSLTGVEA